MLIQISWLQLTKTDSITPKDKKRGSHKVTLPNICSTDEMEASQCLVSNMIYSNDCHSI